MIATDKYEGHTEGEWDLHSMGDVWTIGQLRKIDRTLMQDAPLLLAEVKRLRELLLPRIDEGYTTSYMDLRGIIENVHWELTGDDHESNEERIKYALIALRDVIE